MQRQNKIIHIISLTLNKLGDGLVDPKLVLAWLVNSLGAGVFWVGLLVPLREAGALLPQLFTANRLRFVPVRKWWWVTGSALQAIAVALMIVTALTTTGATAGALIALWVLLFAVARSISSVSYKDVLGKTIEKPQRGRISGLAASIAAAGILLFGLALLFSITERYVLVMGALMIASVCWFLASITFARLHETPSEITADKTEKAFLRYVSYLRNDTELQKFLVVRGLLISTAVAPPFMLLLADQGSGSVLTQLGALVVAASGATFVSGWIWGRLSDYSTRAVLALSGLGSSLVLAGAVLAQTTDLYATPWFLASLIFLLMIMYQGVRIARTIHIVNLANEDTRAGYTAISNTIIGVLLLLTGGLGVLASVTSLAFTLLVLAGMSLFGGLFALRLRV